MIKWMIVDKDKPTVETAWRSLGRLQLLDTKEAGETHLEKYFSRKRREEKTVVPVRIEIVSEAALEPTEPEEEDHGR